MLTRVLIILLLGWTACFSVAADTAKPQAKDKTIQEQMNFSLRKQNGEAAEKIKKISQASQDIYQQLQINKQFTDSTLTFYREQLQGYIQQLDRIRKEYEDRVARAKKFAEQIQATDTVRMAFGDDKTFKVKYDDYFVKMVKEYKEQLSFIQGRLLQIQLLKDDIENLTKKISRKEADLYRQNDWRAVNPLYLGSSWVKAIEGFDVYSSQLGGQLVNEFSGFWRIIIRPNFWVFMVVLAIVFFLYFRYARRWLPVPKSISKHKTVYHAYELMGRFLLNGAFPGLVILVLMHVLLSQLPDQGAVALSFIRSAANAVAFGFFAMPMVRACIRIFVADRHPNEGVKLNLLLVLEIVFFSLVLFINNIDIYGVDTRAVYYYAQGSVAFLNFMFAIILFVLNLMVLHILRKLLQGSWRGRKAAKL